jgi:hypothetical protein
VTSTGPLWIVDVDLVCAARRGRGTGPIPLVPGLSTGPLEAVTRRSHWRGVVNSEPLPRSICGFVPNRWRAASWMGEPVVLPVDCERCRKVVHKGGIIMADEWTAQEAWRESVDRGHRRYRPGPGDPCVCLVD